jgi:quercetin dioxygenase-like cupin family protein
MSFIQVDQDQGTSLRHADVAGFVYAAKGAHVLARDDGERNQLLAEGSAAWASATTEHLNPSSPNAVWYLVSLRSISQRNTAIPFANGKVLYASPDLRTPPADRPLIHQLGLITMAPGGRTSSHSHGGTESFYVLSGTVELALNDGSKSKVSAGSGATVKPGIVMQMRVLGEASVTILTYFVTPQGEPWQTNLETLP